MPTPIDFSFAAAKRSGTFQTSTMNYPGGYSLMEWQLVGLGTGKNSDYENTANNTIPDGAGVNNAFVCTIQFSTDGGQTFNTYGASTWAAGAHTDKFGTVDPPPTLAIGLGNLPPGCQVFVELQLGGSMTIGIGSGVIS
jgi:hypothetical protein